jgi:hypothetical protein
VFELRGYAENAEDYLGEVGCGIKARFGQRPNTGNGALHLAGDNQKIGRAAREAADGRGYHHIAGRQALHQRF